MHDLFFAFELTEDETPVYHLYDDHGNDKGLHAVIPVDKWEAYLSSLDGAGRAVTLSGLYNCQVCGEEKCIQPGICKDCLTPPTEEELNMLPQNEVHTQPTLALEDNICSNCGEPMKYHVGGAKRGLCKNILNKKVS